MDAEIIVISSDEEDEFKSVGHVEHRYDNYKSAPTRKKQLCRRKKRPALDVYESTSSSDSESDSLSTMKWSPSIGMKSDMSHRSQIPNQSFTTGKLCGSIPPHHRLEFERRKQSRRDRQSTQGLRDTREGVTCHKRKPLKKTVHKSRREPCHLPSSYDDRQYEAQKCEQQEEKDRGKIDRFIYEKIKKEGISFHQTTPETILISSGPSDSEFSGSETGLKSFPSLLKASLPLSPHSDSELTDHELGKILDDAQAANNNVNKWNEIDTCRYSPVSPPSSVSSPFDGCGVAQRQDNSISEAGHPTMGNVSENVFPKEGIGNVGVAEDFPLVCEQSIISPTSDFMDQETSDFEEVLSKSTLIALSQTAVSSPAHPEESDDELPEIDCFSAEVSEALLGNVESEGPPLLGRYGLSPTPHDIQEVHKEILRLSDSDDALSLSMKEDWKDIEDACMGSISSYKNIRDSRFKTCVRKLPPPNHVGRESRQGEGKEWVAPFTSHMRNLVEACHEEEFVSASISLTQSLTSTRSIPPAELIHNLLNSVLLNTSVSSSDALQAYKVLHHIHSLHPLSERTFNMEWDFLKNVVTRIVDAMKSYGTSNQWTSQDKPVLALKFVVSVFESEVFHADESSDRHRTPLLERYMVRDVLAWLDVCMTAFDTGSPFVHQQLVQELVLQLQKLLHFSCLQRFGNHRDFVARHLVHNVGHLTLPQKRHLLQTITCHKLRQQLVELYLNTYFEIPCCSLCKSNGTKVGSTCQLSLQKLCNYHVHQRPLEVTQNVSSDSVIYYADEETGERVRIEPTQEASSVRRHCTSCSRRIRLKPEHCEELVLLLLCLLQSLIQCPYPGVSGLSPTVSCQYSKSVGLHKDDEAVLNKLEEHVNILTEDLLLSCSKLTVRTRLYLKEMSCLQKKP